MSVRLAEIIMKNEWFSCADLASMKLSVLPTTPQKILDLAKREGWPARKRVGRGGGQEFQPSKSVQKAIQAHNDRTLSGEVLRIAQEQGGALTTGAVTAVVPFEKPREVLASDQTDARQKVVQAARLGILNAIARAVEQHSMTESRAVCFWLETLSSGVMPAQQMLWCALANDRSGLAWEVTWHDGLPAAIPLAGQLLPTFAAKLGKRTVQRWIQMRSAGGDAALFPHRPLKDMSVPAWAPVFLARMQRPQKPSCQAAWKEMADILKGQGWREHGGMGLPKDKEYPSYSSVNRWYREKYSAVDKARGRNTGSAMNPFKFCHTRTSEGMWPLLEVHSDGWNTHFNAPHPISFKNMTFEAWHSHDVATRKAYIHERAIGLSENMSVIMGSLYAVCAEDGDPTVWQTDNTGSVKNDQVEFDPVSSIAARLGLSIVHNIPGNSQANGIAESFNRYLDARSKELATYQGAGQDALAQKRVHKINQARVKARAKGDMVASAKLGMEAERVGSGLYFTSYAEAVAWLKKVVAEFNDRPHRSLPKISDPVNGKRRHMTPNEMMASFVASGWERKPLVGEVLEDAFRPHVRCKVVRGRVTPFGGQAYHHAMLDEINGEEVLVSYDIHDGNRVWVKNLDGVEMCQAAFYESRSYRVQSFYEMALDKKADAAVKRLNVKIADVEAQRPGVVIEADQPLSVPFTIDMESPAVAKVTVMPEARPNLLQLDDPALIRWLAAHPEDWNDNLRSYLAEQTDKIKSVARLVDEFDLWGELETRAGKAGFEKRAAVSAN